jgi:hypothetical protein
VAANRSADLIDHSGAYRAAFSLESATTAVALTSVESWFAMDRAASPELVDTGYAGWNNVWHFCQECLLINGVMRSDVESRITVEQ